MNETISAPAAESLTSLRELCVPELYRSNPFRVLGAPTTASTRDLARLSEKRKMSEKLGTAMNAVAGPLPLKPAPDAEALRLAMHQLRDPESRLLAELFWFQPRPGQADDPGIDALTRGDSMAAVQAWSSSDADGIGLHNLAVLAHATALDLELAAAPLSPPDAQLRDRCWSEAYERWSALLEHEGFWSRITTRVRELDDPRLTTGMGRRIRMQLPMNLLQISARLLAKAGEAGNNKETSRHFRFISESGFDEKARVEAIRGALIPFRQRIASFCKSAEAEAERTPAQANKACRALLSQTAPLLAVFALLPESDASRQGVHDDVALNALSCLISYGNDTNKWDEPLELLNKIRKIAASASARGRIDLNLATATENVAFAKEFGQCYFCGEEKAGEDLAIKVQMHGNVRRVPEWDGVRVLWNTAAIGVPRCPKCKGLHDRSGSIGGTLAIASVLVGTMSCGSIGFDEGGWVAGVGGFIVAGVLAAVTEKFVLGGVKGAETAQQFSAIQRRIAEGWAVGEKPEGVQ